MSTKTMSEAGDSFEKLEFDQFGLDEIKSAVSQTCTDLAGSDQHLKSESSPTAMSAGQAKAGQPNDLVFELAWDTRDEIISRLNQNSKVLCGLKINDTSREEIEDMNEELVIELMNLPLRVDGRTNSFNSRSSKASSNEVVLDLNWQFRSRIVDALITNHNVALLAGDSVTSECKSKLVDQNNDLICEMLRLQSRTVAIPISGALSSSVRPSEPKQAVLPFQPSYDRQKLTETLDLTFDDQLNVIGIISKPNCLPPDVVAIQEPNQYDYPWQQQFDPQWRSHLVKKLITSILPNPDPKEKFTNSLISFAQYVEKDLFKIAKWSQEYCYLMAEKICTIQKELEGKCEKRRLERLKNQQTTATPSVILQKTAQPLAEDHLIEPTIEASGSETTNVAKVANDDLSGRNKVAATSQTASSLVQENMKNMDALESEPEKLKVNISIKKEPSKEVSDHPTVAPPAIQPKHLPTQGLGQISLTSSIWQPRKL